MAVAKAINKVSDLLDKICSVILVAMLAGMVLTTSLQIICRVFFTALSWSEEVTRYLLVWSTFLGAGCVYKKGGHISVTFAQEKFWYIYCAERYSQLPYTMVSNIWTSKALSFLQRCAYL